MPARQRQASPPASTTLAERPVPATVDEIVDEMSTIAANAAEHTLSDDEANRYEQLESALTAANRSENIRQRQAAYQTPVNVGDIAEIQGAAEADPNRPSSLMPDRAGMNELHAAVLERRGVRVSTPLNVTITTTLTGRPAQPLGVTEWMPRTIAALAGIPTQDVAWGEDAKFPILGAGTPPSATGEGSAKPEYNAVTPGTATPQTLAITADLSGQAQSVSEFSQKILNKLARLVALGENELLRAKVAGTSGVVTQAFVAGDQAVQILRSSATIEAAVNQPPNLMLFNPADTVAIFGTSVANSPGLVGIAEYSLAVFGQVALALNTQPAGFILHGAWNLGSRLVYGLRPKYLTDPFTAMKSNVVTVLLEEALDIAVEEPTAFRIVDIVTP